MAGGDFGASAGSSGGRKSVDVDMNLVPFIDMMSVLVAFLLLTATWVQLSQINIKPGGVGRDTENLPKGDPPIMLSVLITQDSLWIGTTTENPRQIKNTEGTGAYNFDALSEALQYYKKESGIFTDRDEIQIAAEDKVEYQTVISTMDIAVAKGFKGIQYLDPASLSVRFR